MPDGQRESSRASLGLLATGALVVGGIIGTGIFAVPAAVAKFGWVAYPAFVVVTAGSVLLAVAFAEQARQDPRSGGPAYAYAQRAFGPFTGFLSAWGYWIQGWTGQATISVAGAGYAIALLGVNGSGWVLGTSLFLLWLPAVVNLIRPGAGGGVQIAATMLKIVPLLAVGVAGIVLFHPAYVGRPLGHTGAVGALGPAHTESVNRRRQRDPDHQEGDGQGGHGKRRGVGGTATSMGAVPSCELPP
jgi:APA family basic amino acid/polyamine antiporter